MPESWKSCAAAHRRDSNRSTASWKVASHPCPAGRATSLRARGSAFYELFQRLPIHRPPPCGKMVPFPLRKSVVVQNKQRP